MSKSAAGNGRIVRRTLGKGRRRFARLMLGNPIGEHQAKEAQRVQDLWDWVNGMQETVNQLASTQQLVNNEAKSAGEHLDLIVDQLWRRLEAADARIATQVQHLTATTGRQLADLETLAARLRRENAAILRLIGHEAQIVTDDQAAPRNLPIERSTLFAEVESGPVVDEEAKLAQFVTYFAGGPSPVLDLGCGTGRFLDLLSGAGIAAYGVEQDPQAVTVAGERGFDVRKESALEHLRSLDETSLGGAFGYQLVEHLPAESLATLYEELYRVLKPGGRVVIVTPNPATFATHVQSFWRDPSHVRPVPQPALDFAARTAGFVAEQTVYLSPSDDTDKLDRVELEPQDPLLGELVRRFNANVEKLDDLLFGWQEYALVVRKP